MNLADSSAWLAYLADTKNAAHFKKAFADYTHLIVPTVVLYEVSKVLLREQGEETATLVQAHMQQGNIVDLDTQIALLAAHLSIEHTIPMADSIILATAKQFDAIIWTQDVDFKGLAGVKYFPA